MSTELLKQGLTLLFVGFNPSPKSAETGYNYAGPNNRFYRILHESGLVGRLLAPSENRVLFDEYMYGFTNLVQRPTPRASDLTTEEYQAGAARVLDTLRIYQPTFACFVGRGVYDHFSRFAGTPRKKDWGFLAHQLEGVSTRLFVAPATSGLVRMRLADQVAIYSKLADEIRVMHAPDRGTKGTST